MPFDPADFGFWKLNANMDTLTFYELSDQPANGDVDHTKIAVYLSQDGNFVTVWQGLFDIAITESVLGLPEGFPINLREQYTTDLFRGYIPTNADAKVILEALRLTQYRPSWLSYDNGELRCEVEARSVTLP